MEDRVTASAPGKLLLFGEHAVVYGFPCIVTAVNQRMQVTVCKNGKDTFHIKAPDIGLSAYSKTIADLGKKELPKEVQFVEMLYRRFLEAYPQKEGIDVETKSEFSCQFGFGSSSAVTVAFAKALTTLYGLKLNKKELFDLCYQAVLDVQGVGSGFDIASAIWGGTIYYIPPAKVVEKLDIQNLPFIVGYTGVKADTPTLIRQVAEMKRKNAVNVEKIFRSISKIVDEAREAIEKNNWNMVGELLKKNQKLLEQLGVSSVELDGLIEASLRSGALGAKLSGAGGGDCMVALANRKLFTINYKQGKNIKIKEAIRNAGGEVMEVKLGTEGVRVE